MPMTADEYRDTIAALGLSQVGAARMLGVDEATSRRWAKRDGASARDVPEPVSRFLRFMVAARITPATVLKALRMP